MHHKQSEVNKGLQQGLLYLQSQQFDAAKAQAVRVLRLQPKHDLAHFLLARVYFALNDFDAMSESLRASVSSPMFSPNTRSVFQGFIAELSVTQKFPIMEIVALILIERNPNDGDAWCTLGGSLLSQRKYEKSFKALERARDFLPDDIGVLTNLGGVLTTLGRSVEAVEVLKKTIVPHRDLVVSHNNLANAYRLLGLFDLAIEHFEKAIAIKDDYAEAYNNLGLTYASSFQWEKAIEQYHLALHFNPRMVMSYVNLAKALHSLGRLKEAMDCCELALEMQNDAAEIWTCLGDVLRSANHLDQSIECYMKALQFSSDPSGYASRMTFTGLLFSLNYHPELDAESIYGAYRDFDERFCARFLPSKPTYNNLKDPNKKLKVGYVTQSFFHQACVFFLLPLLQAHDSNELELFAYTDLPKADEFTELYKNTVQHWVVTRGLSDEQLAQRIKDDGIDILVDVSGHTSENRLLTFAHKPAPVSLHWLEFGYTTGLKAIDYYLCDRATIPPGTEHLFSEKPWYLEGTSYVYRPNPNVGEINALPALSNGYITLGTLSRAIRLNHKVIRVWAEIMNRIPNSRLIVDSVDFKDPAAEKELASRFSAFGISPDRLDIGFHSPAWDTLRKMDIGLDCFPHNSGTTLFESLYLGIPYVTLAGRPSVGRLGASVLEGLGRPEWIANTEDEYIQKVVELASKLDELSLLRQTIREEMKNSLLMDEIGFAKSVERAYRQMWQKFCEGNS